MDEYDVGLLNDWGGGNVAWWHDCLRYEIARANLHWVRQTESLRAELEECRELLRRAYGYTTAAADLLPEEIKDALAADGENNNAI